MNYLTYIEHAAENLQFFMWYHDYKQRFAHADTADLPLAPEWTQARHDASMQAVQLQASASKPRQHQTVEMFNGIDFEAEGGYVEFLETKDPFFTPPCTPPVEEDAGRTFAQPWESVVRMSEKGSAFNRGLDSYKQEAMETFKAAGLNQPCQYKLVRVHSGANSSQSRFSLFVMKLTESSQYTSRKILRGSSTCLIGSVTYFYAHLHILLILLRFKPSLQPSNLLSVAKPILTSFAGLSAMATDHASSSLVP